MIFGEGGSAATDKFSKISLEYHAKFDEPYATTLGELFTGTTSIERINVTSIYYQSQYKKIVHGKLTTCRTVTIS